MHRLEWCSCPFDFHATRMNFLIMGLFLFFFFDLEAEVAGEAAGALAVACVVVGMVAGA